MEFVDKIRISDRWQIVLTDAVKEKLGVQKGDSLLFFNNKNEIIVRVETRQEMKNRYEKKYKED